MEWYRSYPHEESMNDNPYLREFERIRRELLGLPDRQRALLHGGQGLSTAERRMWCVRRYSFGVPDDAALEAIARRAPIVELGAGTGYWAHLLRARGVDCLAFDLAPPNRSPNPHQFRPLTWTHVEQGGIEILARQIDPTARGILAEIAQNVRKL